LPDSTCSTACGASTSRPWSWPEILRYLGHVADKHDLRRDIRFSTRVVSATWDAVASRWMVRTDRGDEIRCR